MEHLFVYGTLLQGQPNDGLLAGLLRRPGRVRGQLFRQPAGYPVLVPDDAGRPIFGELVRLDRPGVLALLDLFEGVAEGLYQRVEVSVDAQPGPVTAWAYVLTADDARRRKLRPLRIRDWRRYSRR